MIWHPCPHCGEIFISDFNRNNHVANSHPSSPCKSTQAAYGGVMVVCTQMKGHDGPCRTTEPGFRNLTWNEPSPSPTPDTTLKPKARSAAARAIFGG